MSDLRKQEKLLHGSVPQLCNDPDCGDCYDKREALEHAQKGVPQAEPHQCATFPDYKPCPKCASQAEPPKEGE